MGLSADCTWFEVVEDWITSPYRSYWPEEWRLLAEECKFGIPRGYIPIHDMTLAAWAAEIKAMIAEIGYQETWT